MKTNIGLLDSDLDAARMEVQASAELMQRSLCETYRLIASAQRRIRHITQSETASRLHREAA